MDVKKMYSNNVAMVSDDLFDSSDDEINDAIKNSTAGMIIYTAGFAKAKQKSLDGKWVSVDMNNFDLGRIFYADH